MKRIGIVIFLVFVGVFVKTTNAQQAPYYSQYMFNDYLINPAIVGSYNYFQIRANSRNQWLKISDHPTTMGISGYGPIKNKPMGYGGYISNYVTGPESRLSFGASYAYNISINDAMRISGGISIGGMQYKIDGTKMTINNEVHDPVIPQGVEANLIPDAAVGFYLYSNYYYAGISAHQLFGNKYNNNKEVDTLKGLSRLTQHVYLAGGYNYVLNKDFILSPSALIKYTSPVQVQAEITVMAAYKRVVNFGLSYRTSDAIVVLGRYNYENKVYLGLSYDISVSDFRKYKNGGTIEVMLGYRFNAIR